MCFPVFSFGHEYILKMPANSSKARFVGELQTFLPVLAMVWYSKITIFTKPVVVLVIFWVSSLWCSCKHCHALDQFLYSVFTLFYENIFFLQHSQHTREKIQNEEQITWEDMFLFAMSSSSYRAKCIFCSYVHRHAHCYIETGVLSAPNLTFPFACISLWDTLNSKHLRKPSYMVYQSGGSLTILLIIFTPV